MDYSKKQTQLDVKKWVDSEVKGYDTCGSYNYCSNCNKDAAYPCAYAYDKYTTIAKLAKEANTTSTSKKTCAKKSTTAKSSTATVAKKTTTSAAKKTTARKTTTSKKSAAVAA